MNWFIFISVVFISVSSLAKDICLDAPYTLQVTEKGKTEVHPAVLCWEEAYFVRDLGKKIPKNKIMKFEDPYIVYTNLETGKSEQFSLLEYDTHLLCPVLGFPAHIETEKSKTIWPVQLVKPSYRKPISKQNYEIFKSRKTDYVEAIYCGDEFIDLEDLSREHLPLHERHNPRVKVRPIQLVDQESLF